MPRKTYPNLERICRVEVIPAFSRKSIPTYPLPTIRLISFAGKVFQRYNTGFAALG
jgi:hypothetical protein